MGWEGQMNRWEVDLKEMKRDSRMIADGSRDDTENLVLEERQLEMCKDLIRGQGILLNKCQEKLASLSLASE